MTDLDFDELDRAVSSAIGDTSDNSGDATEPKVNSNAIAVTIGAPSTIVTEPTPEPEVQVAPVSTPPITPAARRSSGRFMDVVHPSSDMRSSAPSAPTTSNDVAAKPEWSEPLDSQVPEAAAEPTADDALTSPFLSDAKVDKRPLGAFSDTPKSDDASDDFKSMAPEELDGKLLALENDAPVEAVEQAAQAPSTQDAPDKTDVQATPLLEEGPETSLLEATSDDSRAATPNPVVGAPSIFQQYKERPSTGDQPTGPIFDTETYHKPLTVAPKKKGSWLIVLWIFGLVVLGAGIGAAAYYFLLPMIS